MNPVKSAPCKCVLGTVQAGGVCWCVCVCVGVCVMVCGCLACVCVGAAGAWVCVCRVGEGRVKGVVARRGEV